MDDLAGVTRRFRHAEADGRDFECRATGFSSCALSVDTSRRDTENGAIITGNTAHNTEGDEMAEILGLGLTHYPPLISPDEDKAIPLKRTLRGKPSGSPRR